MGIRSWWRHRRAARDLAKIADGIRGKAMEDLVREGGWDVLARAGDWVKAEDIWQSYSDAKKERVYRVSSIVFACVRKIAGILPDAAMELGRWDDDEWSRDPDHPYVDLLRHPNKTQDWRQFDYSFGQHLLLTGKSYVWKRRTTNSGFVSELHAFPTSWVAPRVDAHSKIMHYGGSTGTGVVERIPPEDMMVWRMPDPSSPSAGAGPLGAALRDLQIDDARAAQMIEIMTNTHFAGTVLKQKDSWTTEQMDEMRRILRDVIGPGKRGQPLFVGSEGEVEFPEPKEDMDWPGTANLSESRICAAYSIPPILLGLRAGLERSTFSNYEESNRSFYQSTMRGYWQDQAGVLEHGLLRAEEDDDGTEVEPNWDDIPQMQEEADKIHERALKDFHGGLITLDRALELIGEPAADEGGDVRLLPMNLVEFTPGGAPETVPAEGAPGDEHEEEWEGEE